MENEFVPGAKVGEMAPGDLKLVEARGQMVALANVDGQHYAFGDTCTHMECSLSDGNLEGDVVECPCHGSQFNVRTGAVEDGPAQQPVPVYAVRIQGQDILIGPKKAGPA
ncbi:MAG: non-heme iron oxygenase ferredoxin subunit [Chloroflexi bacterium]|nr:non-heme iron oxygenase ferredoxin subunit [Chloroflexota bacterium]